MLSNTQDIFLPLVCNQVHHDTDAGDNKWGCGGSGLGNLFGMVYVTQADKNALCAMHTSLWFISPTQIKMRCALCAVHCALFTRVHITWATQGKIAMHCALWFMSPCLSHTMISKCTALYCTLQFAPSVKPMACGVLLPHPH